MAGGKASGKECFVIAPIGEVGSEVRKRSNQVLKHLIAPAAARCGYGEPTRADMLSEAGMITTQIIQKIMQVPLVVADLTGRNPNVYYELALRHAIRKPCIQLIAEGEPLPFDVAGFRTIQVNYHDLDSVEEAREEMVRQIRALDGKADVDSPISTAVDLETFKKSSKPEERFQGEVLAALAELRADVATLTRQVQEGPKSPVATTLTLPSRYAVSDSDIREFQAKVATLSELRRRLGLKDPSSDDQS